jgi:Domain of unknown function (DUF4399)
MKTGKSPMTTMLLSRRTLLASTALIAVPSRLFAATSSPPGAECYFINLRNGQKVKSPVTIRFGLKGMGVTHAGDEFKNAGHHHLLIDVTQPLDPEDSIPADKNHVHFGAGQTETTIELSPGVHTLQLVLGDANHQPFNPSVQSPKIKITITK